MDKKTVRTVATAVAVTLALVAGGWFGWEKYIEHKETEKTRQVAESVKTSMQEKMSTDSDFGKYGLTVSAVNLIRVGDTRYEGIAAVHTARSSANHDVSIEVIADDQSMMWKAKPGEFLWLMQESA